MRSIVCVLAYIVAVVLSQASGTIPVQCCICDDFSSDPTQRCDIKGICGNSYSYCPEYCETAKTFLDKKWYTTRKCGQETACIEHWYHTVTSLGCVDNTRGEPDNGTTCYKCCKIPDPFHPHFCLDNPETNFVTFPVTIGTTTPKTTSTTITTIPTTMPTTVTTTPTTTPTTVTTTLTTTPTAVTTTKPATVTTNMPATVATTTLVPTTTQNTASTSAATCETCTSDNCTRPISSRCGIGEQYCMNTIIQHGNGTSSVKKSCASELECYYDAYIAMEKNPGCGTSSSKAACHYCCQSSAGEVSPCNTDTIPQNVINFGNNQGSTGTVCEVGRDGAYKRMTCDAATPLCMNTVVLQTNLTLIKKTCESEVLCDQDWWTLTRARSDCMTTDFTSLPVRDQGLVCHYCCKSSNGSACNTEQIPDDVKQIISRVDGGWSVWSLWQGCTVDCKGIRVRIRTCSRPFPSQNGRPCAGDGSETETCGPTNCQIAGTAIVG